MSVFLNVGKRSLERAVAEEIFVDKTLILAQLNKYIDTNRRFVCMSRPRRFGKSYVGKMMSAYYSKGCDSIDVFSKLKFGSHPDFEKYRNKFNFIQIDLNGCLETFHNQPDKLIENIEEAIIAELAEQIKDIDFSNVSSLAEALIKANDKTGERFIVFIDEYDILIRDPNGNKHLDKYLKFLSSLFKNSMMEEPIALAYITGILPIVRDRVQSKMNEFYEYTMLSPGPFAQFMGFTEQEAQELCERFDMDYNQCKEWYDGYKMNSNVSILSPRSVNAAMSFHKYANYWSQTGAFDVVNEVITIPGIEMNQKVLQLLERKKVIVDVLNYPNSLDAFDKDDNVLTYLIHLGYLAYNEEEMSCYIPNTEVAKQWQLVAKNLDSLKDLADVLEDSRLLLQATINGNAQAVALGLDKAHDITISCKGYNDENCFQSAISYAYYYSIGAYTMFKELPTGKGFADVVFLPKSNSGKYPAMVVELKVEGTTGTAMDQIRQKQYGANLAAYVDNMLLVAISYNKQTKKHTCQIERFKP